MSITLNSVNSGYNLSVINDNFQELQTYINNSLLSRADTGVTGEAMMNRDLDMNGFTILNADLDVSSITNDRAIRVPAGEGTISPLPNADTRKGTILSFDINTGLPVTVAPTSGSATDVLNQLAINSDVNKGDALIGVKIPYTGGYGRTQHSKNTDFVTPEDFGATGTGVELALSTRYGTLLAAQAVYPFVTSLSQSIDYAALQAALNTGKPVNIISQLMVSDKIVSSNKNISVNAAGVGQASVKFTTANGGFDFTLKPQDSTPPQMLNMIGFDIISDIAVSNPAIKASWGVRQPNASGQCIIENVRIHSGSATTGSFEAGIDLIYAFRVFLNKVQILGDNARTGNDAFRAQGCVEINHTDCLANRYKCPARIKKYNVADQQTEGIWFKGCWFYDCNRGIYSPDQSIHISIIETFINPNGTAAAPISNVAAIDITNCSQFNIVGNVLYIGGLATDGTNQDCIRIAGTSSGGVIASNQLVSVLKANTRYGIIINGNVIYSHINNNKISGFTNEAINILNSGCTGNHIISNQLYDCGGWIIDAGTGTVKVNNTKCAALDVPLPLNPVLTNASGLGGIGTISGDSNWGMLLYPYTGTVGHLGLCDSAGTAVAGVFPGRFGVRNYTKTALPAAGFFGGGMTGLIGVVDDVGGHTLAFSDGTNWRRVQDRNVIS